MTALNQLPSPPSPLPQCDACTPNGFDHHQQPGESAIWVPRMREWLCQSCRKTKGVSDIPTQDGLYPGIHELDYRCDTGSLSHSGARAILPPGSPAAYRWWRDNYDPTHTTEALNFGSAVHTLVLGAGPEVVVVGENYKSQVARVDRDEAWAAGKIPLRKAEYGVAADMAAAVKDHPLAARLLDTDQTEVSGWYHDEPTGTRLRYRVDAIKQLANGRFVGVDYKTTVSADPGEFARSAAKFGYYMQAAWYVAGLVANGIDTAGFLFVCQEKEPPYLVSVDRIVDEHVALGAMRNRRAVDLYAACVESGVWPGYGDGINEISLPGWMIRQHQQEVDQYE